jgi:hypothetical protein
MSKRRLVISAVLAGQSQSEVARTYGVSQGWIRAERNAWAAPIVATLGIDVSAGQRPLSGPAVTANVRRFLPLSAHILPT